MKKNNIKKNQKIIIPLIIILLIILLIAGGTYAYWSWTSNNTTNVLIVVGNTTDDDPDAPTTFELKITGAYLNATNLAPIASCYKANGYESQAFTFVGLSTVEASNIVSTDMTATLQLEAKFADDSTVTDTEKAYFHYAISEVSASDTSASSTICNASGVTSGGYKTGTFASVGNDNYTTIVSDLTFNVPANTKVTKYYHVYVWLDSNSEEVTSQNQTLYVNWSSSSMME